MLEKNIFLQRVKKRKAFSLIGFPLINLVSQQVLITRMTKSLIDLFKASFNLGRFLEILAGYFTPRIGFILC